jgi:hypothetical protein
MPGRERLYQPQLLIDVRDVMAAVPFFRLNALIQSMTLDDHRRFVIQMFVHAPYL